jgi:hypothetical protein
VKRDVLRRDDLDARINLSQRFRHFAIMRQLSSFDHEERAS